MPRTTSPSLDLSAASASSQPVIAAGSIGAHLRPWTTTDAPAVRTVYTDPSIQQWHCQTIDTDTEATELITRWVGGWSRGNRAEWAVVSDTYGLLLGRVAIKVADPDGVGDVAYWTAPESRGRGVAPAALQAAVDWAFTVGYQRLQLVHSVQNSRSCQVASKVGFEAEATLLQSVLHTDGWHDMHQHALLA